MDNRKLINIVKGDIKNAINEGDYTRNTEKNSNIEFDTKNKQILLDGVPYSNPLMVETTYNELKNLRDNSQLVPGSFYRITDYECTTTLENTQSAGHKFDIILLALSEDRLLEEGWAIRNENNLYDVTFSDNVTKKCWIYFDGSHYNIVDDKTQLGDNSLSSGDITLDFSAKTASCPTLSSASLIIENLSYNNDYFKNSNLSAWRVWYSLDNDTNRFAWADDSVDATIVGINEYTRYPEGDTVGTYKCWATTPMNRVFTEIEDVKIGDTIYVFNKGNMVPSAVVETIQTEGTGLPNGRGVIYRLIDEWNNDVCYDFKNIQYYIPINEETNKIDKDNGVNTWIYTFCDNNNDGYTDGSIFGDAANNKIIYKQLVIDFPLPCDILMGLGENCIINGYDILINCYSYNSIHIPDYSESIYINDINNDGITNITMVGYNYGITINYAGLGNGTIPLNITLLNLMPHQEIELTSNGVYWSNGTNVYQLSASQS